MTELTGLPQHLARDLTTLSLPARDAPRPGELWTLAWDETYLGLACIAEVMDGYVLAWPVTTPDEPAFAPALDIASTILGHGLFVWPTRETGLGSHLLDRSLGKLLSEKSINPLAISARLGEPSQYPYAAETGDSGQNTDADEVMVDHWAALCFHVWPPDGRDLYLSAEKVRAQGGSPQRAAQVLAADVAEMRDYWIADKPVTFEQARKVANDLGVEVEEVTGTDPLQHVFDRLSSPIYKEDIVVRAQAHGIGEGQMRELVRSDFALAARDDSSSLTDTKLRDAIQRAEPSEQV